MITRSDLEIMRRVWGMQRLKILRHGKRAPSWFVDREQHITIHLHDNSVSVAVTSYSHMSTDGVYRDVSEHHPTVASALERIPALVRALRRLETPKCGSCNKLYPTAQWDALPLLGINEFGEWRNCGCGSTMLVP